MEIDPVFNARLEKADRIEITTIVDNYTDTLLASSETKRDLITRATTALKWKGGIQPGAPLAEHGISLLIRLFKGNQQHTVIFDGGRSKTAIRHNLRALNIDLAEVEAIILSHGHIDHYGGFYEIPKYLQKSGVPLIAHPDAFLDHYNKQPNGTLVKRVRLLERPFEKAGMPVKKHHDPQLLAANLVISTGEVERCTDFETIPAGNLIKRNGKLEPDLVLDDQSLVISLKDKGLVVISGCAHSGIINTVRYARKITQTDRVYAVLGGFHLAGPRVESLTELTINALSEINPAVVVPMHCVSWHAMTRIHQAMPHAFIMNSVGTKLSLS
jgi:7,8-dihydropterin-6-yl-methyl-4-(beta-D-ribofuranosyl)aminobenzene 5'-phosphate synthase